MPPLSFACMLICVVFFVRAADAERASPVLWGTLSFVLWTVTAQVLQYSLIYCLLLQACLFGGIAVYRSVIEERATRERFHPRRRPPRDLGEDQDEEED